MIRVFAFIALNIHERALETSKLISRGQLLVLIYFLLSSRLPLLVFVLISIQQKLLKIHPIKPVVFLFQHISRKRIGQRRGSEETNNLPKGGITISLLCHPRYKRTEELKECFIMLKARRFYYHLSVRF
jgi:hypothetical protein